MSALPVAVGDDHDVGGGDGIHELWGGHRGAVADRLLSGDQPGGGGVDDAVSASGQHDDGVGGAHDRLCVGDLDQRDRSDRHPDRRLGQRLLVDHRHGWAVRRGFAVVDRNAEPVGTGSEQLVGQLRAWCPEAVECRVTGKPDRVGAEQPGDRGDGGELGDADLEAVVEGVEQVHRRRRTEG